MFYLQGEEKVLWAESRASYVFLAIFLFFFAVFFFFFFQSAYLSIPQRYSIIVPGPSNKADMDRLLVIAIGIITIPIFLLLSLWSILIKPLKITEKGIFIGNKYLVSQENPSTSIWSWAASSFRAPIHRSRFFSWSEIKKASVSKITLNWVLYGLYTEHKFLQIETISCEKIWAEIGMGLKKFREIGLDELLAQNLTGRNT